MSYTSVMQTFRVDCGRATFLPLCSACTWRGPVEITRADAMRRADQHAVAVHPNTRAARTAADARARALVAV